MKAYKIVRICKGLKCSAFAYAQNSPEEEEYKGVFYVPGEFVETGKEHLKLFCFKDLNSAYEWFNNFTFYGVHPYELWEVEVEDVAEDVLKYFTNTTHRDIDSYIIDKDNHKTKDIFNDNVFPPHGTLAATRVKLKKLIQSWNLQI